MPKDYVPISVDRLLLSGGGNQPQPQGEDAVTRIFPYTVASRGRPLDRNRTSAVTLCVLCANNHSAKSGRREIMRELNGKTDIRQGEPSGIGFGAAEPFRRWHEGDACGYRKLTRLAAAR